MNKVIEQIKKGVFLMDGAMGTQIQNAQIPDTAWGDRSGCNEWLNLTAPDVIRSIHMAYFNAGSDAVETNTFGASPVTLGEYGISEKAFEINKAAARIAREAADACGAPTQPRFVFGSIGPGTKLPTLGQISFDALCDALQVQVSGLLEGGADGIIIETCQDLLQIKTALIAFDKVAGPRSGIPVYVSVTVEQTGTLLIGSNIGAIVATLLPYPVDILGLNCATGPEAMRIHLDYLAENWPRHIAAMPNAGMPIMGEGGVEYPLHAEEFGRVLGTMVREIGMNVAGGCCGTTPAHIQSLRRQVDGFVAPARSITPPEQASSVFAPMDLTQEPAPLYIGERANATGSKKFRETLLADDHETAFSILSDQEENGAHILDLNCAYAGRDEVRDVEILMGRAAQECRLPMMIDTTQPEVMETALKRYGGRMLINSVNLEAGEERAAKIVELARLYGAGLVCLTIDEEGMAKTTEQKVTIAKRLVAFCEEHGLQRADLFIDTLTFTIASGDDTLRTAAVETLDAITRIKRELPGVRTILGLSNISFGLTPASRKVLNALFLDRAIKAGLDAAIINVATIVPMNQIPEDAVKVAMALLYNDTSTGDPLEQYIHFFQDVSLEQLTETKEALSPEDALTQAVIKGKSPALPEIVPPLLETHSAESILNDLLVPAMKEVGRLFNDGILQLPFVLKSAEVMKKAVDLIKPHMKKDENAAGKGTMVLATVSGDVHDIGKNLVDIILSNNGFSVANIGTKISVEQMIAAVREHRAEVLGMSGLLVKSVAIMAENMKALEAAGIQVPVFLGGAALNAKFVAESCQPHYSGPIVYCRDAFEGLAKMREFADTGRLDRAVAPAAQSADVSFSTEPVEIDLSTPAPRPPFYGPRIVRDINLHDVYPLLNETALIRGRWGYRRGNLDRDAYAALIEKEVKPRLEQMKIECTRSGLLKPAVAYGYYKCRAEGDTLWVYPEKDSNTPVALTFPRQPHAPGLSIPDFFRPDEDVAAFMTVTLGDGVESESMQRLKKDQYQDYFLLHGFAVEVTDALAEFWHKIIRRELGIEDPPLSMQDYITQKYRGSRYGFGYPACPDLAMNKTCCDLVHAEEIDVSVSETFMMIPEVTTCALIAHHPQAKYFYMEP